MAINLASSLKGCRSWDDLQKRWKDCDKKTKGDLFEALVKNYLLLTPEFASKFKAVWGFKEIPSSVLQKLKLPSSDKGIDLVAETKEGDYWAIQCKYREDSSDQITWREISTFMGLYLGRKQISFGLIASTTERITKVLKDHDRVGFLAYDIWQGLDEEFFKRLQARLYKKKEPLKARLPRPHQKEAIHDAVAYFKKRGNSRGKLIMPCGTGKSLTSFFIAEKLKAQKVLIAVPSLSLIRQTLKEWMRESLARNHKVEWICVCSDESAGKIDQDDTLVLTQDLGVPCLTDSKQIGSWLKRKHKSRTIIFTTYQSGQALAKAARNTAFAFDLGIMDEAHKTAGAKDRLFSHLILDKNIKITRRLFMTATERRYRGDSDEILSMEDPEDYGETIHKLSFKKALEYKPAILSDYRVVTIHISRDEIADLVRNRAFVRPKMKGWRKEIEAENLAALIALRKAMRRYPIRHAVSFHGSIKRAKEFKESNDAYSNSFPSNTIVKTFHVSGKTPTGTRAKEIEEFSKAPKGLITNARCLTEGVDVPNIDGILFADPRKSLVDIVQAIGRALRPAPRKKFGYVLVPVTHKKNAKPEEIIESESFKEVFATLRAMASQDDRIIEYFRTISRRSPQKNYRPFEGVLTGTLSRKVNLAEFNKSIELRCWDRLAKLSWRPFNEARKIIRSLQLESREKYNQLFDKQQPRTARIIPLDIPLKPDRVYKENGWESWSNWLGSKNIATNLRQYTNFFTARKFARSLKLKNQKEWRLYCKGCLKRKLLKPEEIPASPNVVYKNSGWAGFSNWLGNGCVIRAPLLHYKEAKTFIKNKKFRSALEFKKWIRIKHQQNIQPYTRIPKAPEIAYKNKGWISWSDWLGCRERYMPLSAYLPYEKAKNVLRKEGLKNRDQWRKFTLSQRFKHPCFEKVPISPDKIYGKALWKGWGDWLSSGNIATRKVKFWNYSRASKYLKKLKIKNSYEWRQYLKNQNPKMPKRNKYIPTNPQKAYRTSGWKTLSSFLGFCAHDQIKKTWASKYLKIDIARKKIRPFRLKSKADWKKFVKKKKQYLLKEKIPRQPNHVYRNSGWAGWPSFLGSARKR